jgi:hypothetical protein
MNYELRIINYNLFSILFFLFSIFYKNNKSF